MAHQHRGRSNRGGLGKYLRARGRRGGGRPAEFGKEVLEDGADDKGSGDESSTDDQKYAKRPLDTNAHRYEEPEVDPHIEQEPEPEIDLSSFRAREQLADDARNDRFSHDEHDDDVDHTLSNLLSPNAQKNRKNKTQVIEWDASMDELKREKESAEAVWDLKSRFRKNLTVARTSSSWEQRGPSKAEDSRHVQKPPDADDFDKDVKAPAASKADMEGFLDDLLS